MSASLHFLLWMSRQEAYEDMADTVSQMCQNERTIRHQPIVSVVIPAYNGAQVIGETIRSVLNQSYADYELIVVDDASVDRTVEVLSGIQDPRLRIVRNATNLGFEGNFNRALEEARGEFIKVLPMDDLLYPTCLERQVEILEANENRDVCLVSCAKDVITRGGEFVIRGRKGFSGRMPGSQAIRRTVRAGTNIIGEPGSVLFRRSLLAQVGRFDGSIPYIIDLDLWCRLLLHGDAYIIPETLCAFRVWPNSMSVKLARTQTRQLLSFFSRLSSRPEYGVRAFDRCCGSVRAFVNTMARMVIYRMLRANA